MDDCKYCGGTWTTDDDGQKFIVHRMGCPDIDGAETKKNKQVERLQAENNVLKKFTRTVIESICWGIDGYMDNFDVQELAEKLGLIKLTVATDKDADEESDFRAGDEIYKFTDILESGEEWLKHTK